MNEGNSPHLRPRYPPSLIMALRVLLAAGLLVATVFARTNLDGCTYYDSVVKPTGMAAYATRIFYVPDTGEICTFHDCGGGRAPPATTRPGCPGYTGTETVTPKFLTLSSTVPTAKTTSSAPVTIPGPDSPSASITAAPTVVPGGGSGNATVTGSVSRTTTVPGGAGRVGVRGIFGPCLVAGALIGMGML